MLTIPDLGLRRAFACALGGDLTKPPRAFEPADLARIDLLSWTDTGEAEAYPGRWTPIEHLDGVERCTAAQEIALNGNHLRDLSPLAACVAVEQLWLGCNNIADLGPVAALPALRRLSVYHNPITSVAPLAGAPALQLLDLGGTRVLDFSPLLQVASLSELRLSHYRPELDETQVEVLAELRARGVNVVLYGDLDARVKAALAQRALAGAGAAPPAVAAAIEALRAAGLDALAAGLLEDGPEARDVEGNTALHQLAVARPEKLGRTGEELAALAPLLVAAGVDPNAQDLDNLDTAVSLNLFRRGDPAIFRALLEVTTELERPPHRTALTHALYALSKQWPEAEAHVQALRERGADITAASAVVMAARAGALDLVREALEAGADPNAAAYFYGTSSLLSVAIRRDDLALTRELLDRGASPTLRQPIGGVRSAEALHLLLERGATLPEVHAPRRRHPLHELAAVGAHQASDEALEKAMGLVDAVVALGQSVDVRTWDGHTLVGKLVDNGSCYRPEEKRRSQAFVDHLFASGADPRALSPHGQSALDFTRRSEVRDQVKAHKVGKGATMATQDAKKLAKAKVWAPATPAWALLRGVAARDAWALTGAEAACKQRLRALVEAVDHPLTADVLASGDLGLAMCWMHDRGASLDPAGRTALLRAVRVSDPELRRRLVLGLIEAGADPTQYGWGGDSPLTEWLYWGAPREYDEVVFEALAVPGATRGALGRVALASGWDPAVRERVVEALIGLGASVSDRSEFEALVRIGSPRLLALALERGAEVNPGLAGEMESTPLAIAIEGGRLEAARWLLEQGADPNGNGYTVPLHKARTVEAIDLLVAHGADPGQRRVGHGCDTALHVLASAAQYNLDDAGFDCIERLIALGLDPRTPNTRGDTALGLLKRSGTERAREIVASVENQP